MLLADFAAAAVPIVPFVLLAIAAGPAWFRAR